MTDRRWSSMRELSGSRERWREFETSANEAAYARWMRGQEEGDAWRDELERRREVPEGAPE